MACKTTIGYTLPDNNSVGEIVFTDKTGFSFKKVKVTGKTGTVDLNTSNLAEGIYQYTLYVNGVAADTKQMVLVR